MRPPSWTGVNQQKTCGARDEPMRSGKKRMVSGTNRHKLTENVRQMYCVRRKSPQSGAKRQQACGIRRESPQANRNRWESEKCAAFAMNRRKPEPNRQNQTNTEAKRRLRAAARKRRRFFLLFGLQAGRRLGGPSVGRRPVRRYKARRSSPAKRLVCWDCWPIRLSPGYKPAGVPGPLAHPLSGPAVSPILCLPVGPGNSLSNSLSGPSCRLSAPSCCPPVRLTYRPTQYQPDYKPAGMLSPLAHPLSYPAAIPAAIQLSPDYGPDGLPICHSSYPPDGLLNYQPNYQPIHQTLPAPHSISPATYSAISLALSRLR